MTLKKKILGSIFILFCLGLVVGGYFWWQKEKTEKPKETKMETEGLAEDLSSKFLEIDFIDSPLERLKMPEMDLEIPLDFGNFNLQIPDLSGKNFINVKTPQTQVNVSGIGETIDVEAMIKSGAVPPPDWEPDEATCQKFKAAPSCLFVPEQYRDLCEKCKAKGY